MVRANRCPAAGPAALLHGLLTRALAPLLLLPSPAWAQPASETARCEARATEDAKQYQEKANSLISRKEYARAIEEVELAYRLCPHPVLLLNLAEISEKQKDLAQAAYDYGHYLRLLPEGKAAGKARAALARLDAVLAKTRGRLELETTPAGAQVTLDGRPAPVLETPLVYWLLPGPHKLDVRKQDFKPASQTVELVVGQTRNLQLHLEPAQGDGELSIEAVEGARVLLDGEQIGLAPIRGFKTSPGQHTVNVIWKGAQNVETTVNVPAGEATSIQVEMAPVLHRVPGAESGEAHAPQQAATGGGKPWWAIGSLAALGAGAAVAAIACYAHAGSLDDEGNKIAAQRHLTQRELDQSRAQAQDRYDQAQHWRRGGVAGGVAAVAAWSGAVWLGLRSGAAVGPAAQPAGSPGDAAVWTVLPLPGGALAGVRLAF